MMKVLKTHSVRMAAGLLALMGLLVFGCKQDAGTETIVVAYTPLRGIEVTTPPAKVVYDIADELDLTGLRVTATYSDKSTKVIDNKDLMFSDFDTTTSGSKIVEIYYEEEDGRSAYAYFTILVNPYGKTLDRLEITADPTKTIYEVGDGNWDISGMEVYAIWDDESSYIIDLLEAVISIDTSTPGEDAGAITVEWGAKKVSFAITTVAGVDVLELDTSNLFFLLTDGTLSNGGVLDPVLFDELVITGISQKLVDDNPDDEIDPVPEEIYRRILDNADCPFETIDDMGIPGRKVVTVSYKNSLTGNSTTGEITVKVLSQAMYQLAVYVKNAPGSTVAVKVPASVTRNDVMFDYGDDYGVDNLGGLYEALGRTKYIDLDLSAVTWTVAVEV